MKIKIKILNKYSYQIFPIVEDMIEISTKELAKIGNGYKFDLATKTIVIDTEYQKEKEKEEILNKIAELKIKLEQTDYQTIKYVEGHITEEQYIPIKEQRQLWRDEINKLESQLNN